MRIGILTFHGSSNPGAFWQAYATCQLLERLGHIPQIIDYYSPLRHHRSHWFALKNITAWRRPDLLALVVAQRFAAASSRKALPLSPLVLNAHDISNQSYDAILIGSDVVWESPVDAVYLGEGLGTDHLIAYAASAGGSNAETTELPAAMRKTCPFSAISVRDQNTRKLLDRAGWADNAQLISDPTITLEVPLECFKHPPAPPYLLVYCSRRPPAEMCTSVRQFARNRNLKIIAVFYPQRWVDQNVMFLTAQRWMSYLANAECVVTDTFHGAVLSCLHNRPHAVVNLSAATSLKAHEQYVTLNIDTHIVSDTCHLVEKLEQPMYSQNKYQTLMRDNISFLQNLLSF